MHDASQEIAQLRERLNVCEARAGDAESKLRERDAVCSQLQQRLEALADADNEKDGYFKADFAANLVAELEEPDHKNAAELEAECRRLQTELLYCEEEEKKLKQTLKRKIKDNNDLQRRLEDIEKKLQDEHKVCNTWRVAVENLERKLKNEQEISKTNREQWQILKTRIETGGVNTSTNTPP